MTPPTLWSAIGRFWPRLLLFGLPLWLLAAEIHAWLAALLNPGPAFLAHAIVVVLLAALALPVWRRILGEPAGRDSPLRLIWPESGWRMVLLGLTPALNRGAIVIGVLLIPQENTAYFSPRRIVAPWPILLGLPLELFGGLFLAGAAVGFFYVERRQNGLATGLRTTWREQLRLFGRVLAASLLCMLLSWISALLVQPLGPGWLTTRLPFALGHGLVPLILAQRLMEARARAEQKVKQDSVLSF